MALRCTAVAQRNRLTIASKHTVISGSPISPARTRPRVSCRNQAPRGYKMLVRASKTKKGMAQVARNAGLSRESLYKALSGERSPDFDTILRVMAALGLKLHAEAAQH